MSNFDFQDLPNFTLGGITLNHEERTVIKSALDVKCQDEKLAKLCLWGKIYGVNKDYYVAQGFADHETWFTRKYFYSLDLVNWLQLNNVTNDEMIRIFEIQSRFYGDPAYEYPLPPKETPDETLPTTLAEEPEQDASPMILNEEKRLAGVVALINYEALVVPRGAFYRNALGELKPNPSFEGLPKSQMNHLTSYFHFRAGYNGNKKSMLERAQFFDETIDVLQPLSEDEPRGMWALQVERGGTVAILRNLIWPGFTFFHTSTPPKWGSIYIGTGQRNGSIGYML
ncbi:Radial spoke head protein 9 [Nowakowskiella sp. JEL0078]|nr:Radial spoke head protein 9 [Nowakowskiella sp. JEL0078]